MDLFVPEEVRRYIGNPRAMKIDVTEHLAGRGFDRLVTLISKRTTRAALGLRPKDKYWLDVFDALAIGIGGQVR